MELVEICKRNRRIILNALELYNEKSVKDASCNSNDSSDKESLTKIEESFKPNKYQIKRLELKQVKLIFILLKFYLKQRREELENSTDGKVLDRSIKEIYETKETIEDLSVLLEMEVK